MAVSKRKLWDVALIGCVLFVMAIVRFLPHRKPPLVPKFSVDCGESFKGTIVDPRSIDERWLGYTVDGRHLTLWKSECTLKPQGMTDGVVDSTRE